MIRMLGIILSFLLWVTPAAGMKPLDDSSMAGITAGDGVAIALELRINADSDGNPLTASSPDSINNFDCQDINGPCRIGLNIANRPDEWLVIKGLSALLLADPVFLDAQSSMGDVGSDPGLFNLQKFRDSNNNCLLPGGVCSAAAIGAMPALRISYPQTDLTTHGYDSSTGLSSGYDSLEIGVRMDGIAVEFGQDAFHNNTNDPYLGVNVRDTNSNVAGMAISGNAFIFGF